MIDKGWFERKGNILFTDISKGSKDREGKEIPEDTEHKLIDPNIKGHFGDDMVASIE